MTLDFGTPTPTQSTHAPHKWSFELNYSSPPPGLSANDTGSKWKRINSTKHIRTEVYYKVKALRIPTLQRIRVEVEWVVVVDRDRDASNLGLFTKPIYDGIGAKHEPSAHVVADDTAAFMDTPTPTIRLARNERARFIVTITEVEVTK
ncbi:hypothetical protein KPL76_06300 [Subtercola sp. PAMC28395]|uniref:hypothetical protein n=1 Tax=Subtercola sp. PAMC28395 TaxID=2846775 RepID=UPI001C0E7956|nr:hypothetical protein [Subtercola sp. PAMC28395]QWT24965.1 hypothetical protein KPL76_06300 [Subtercola sp. PAMC28395]